MADFSQGGPPPPPPMLHTGRIPSFRNNHGENFQNRCGAEPPACVQNAMMTKDKKPFTYTPGGLDLSQIRTPSMARRLNKQQQQLEDQENPAYFQRQGMNGGPPPPPPIAGAPPPPPPPPPLVINVSKSPKTVAEGERPEIVIPKNPIGMLRKTHSPYHWESELSDRMNQGQIPKFVEKSATPSPIAPQMRIPPPRQFSQQPPQQTIPTSPYENRTQQHNNKSPSTSPIWKPEPKYPSSPQSYTGNSPAASPQIYSQQTPPVHTPTKDLLQRQDSQFNHSPSPYNRESASTTPSKQTSSPFNESQSSMQSVTPISSPASPWKQDQMAARNSPPRRPDSRSPYQNNNNQNYTSSPIQVEVRNNNFQQPKSPLSPVQTMRGPSNSPQIEQQSLPQPIYNNVSRQVQSPDVQKNVEQKNVAPWRQGQQQQEVRNSPQIQQSFSQSPNSVQSPTEVRYQTHMTIPVTPRKPKNEAENSPPVQNPTSIFSPRVLDSPSSLQWAHNDNPIKKSVPQPPWCQKPVETRKSLPRESIEQSESEQAVQPPWIQKQAEMRKSVPKDSGPAWVQQQQLPSGGMRVIPIQMEVSKKEVVQNNNFTQSNPPAQNMQGRGQQQPQLRIIIDMNQQGKQGNPPSSQTYQPQQQITRVIQPQIVKMDDNSSAGNSSPQVAPQGHQPRTRIIPIQMEPSSPGVVPPRVILHQISREFAPRQSPAFRVLQVTTGTNQDEEGTFDDMESHGFSDL